MVLCRLCYLEINDELYKNIFDDKLEPPIWKIVYELANLNILETDPYTKFVCFECFDQLLKFYIFRKTVLENDQKFKQNNQQQFKITTNENCNNNNKDEPCIKMEIEDEDYDLIDEKVDVKEYQVNIDEDFLESVNTNDSGTDIDDKSTIRKIQIPNMIDNNMDDNTIDNNRNEVDCLSNGDPLSHTKVYISDSESEIILTQPGDITISRNNNNSNNNNLIPEKSKKIYERIYMQFIDWTNQNNITTYTEDVLIAYFNQLSNKMKSSSLWKEYSILKSTLNIKHQIDIAKYTRLYARLKRESEGYEGKQAKIFTPDEIRTFILEAPDNIYLMIKVALIFGIMGACRRHELHKLKFADVNDMKSTILVTIKEQNTKVLRKFTIPNIYYNVCRKYMDLRPKNCNTVLFFLQYSNGKCTSQQVGINKFGNMGKQIAKYLKLPDPHLYTGHCFRRSSTAISIDDGGDFKVLKHVTIECVPP